LAIVFWNTIAVTLMLQGWNTGERRDRNPAKAVVFASQLFRKKNTPPPSSLYRLVVVVVLRDVRSTCGARD